MKTEIQQDVVDTTIESILKFRREQKGWVTTSHTMTLKNLNELIKNDLFNIFSEVRIEVKNGIDVKVTIPR